MARYLPDELVISGKYRPDCIGELTHTILARCEQAKKAKDPVLEAWEHVVPPGLASHCQVRNFTGARLLIAVDSSAYLYELNLCRTELVKAVQELCPTKRINDIRFTLGTTMGRS